MADVKKILSQMTIEEKIGQLMLHNGYLFINSKAGVTGPMSKLGMTEETMQNVGSVLNFSDHWEMRDIQDNHLAHNRLKIPLLFMMDVIHGFRTIFPIPLAIGCSFDPKLMEECARMAAKEASAGGVQVTYTPMVDYVRDARWGRVMETGGEDPLLNSLMGAAQVKGFQNDDLKKSGTLATCVKHFAAYGGAEAGRDYNAVELSEHILREFYLPAYKACVDAGATMVMTSFNVLNGVPSTANSWLMQTILREEWGFEGVVVSDHDAVLELLVHGIAPDEKVAAKLAFQNGCDMEMATNCYLHHLKELIDEGVFTESQLDESVLRVLELKNRLGLFEDPYHGASTAKGDPEEFLTAENRAIARRAAEECAVLLKNDGILPLSHKISKLALIGPFADNHEIIGFWSCNGKNEESITLREGISSLLPDADITVVKGCGYLWNDSDRSGFEEAVAAAQEADAVILCLGEPQYYSGEGNSRTDIRLPGVQEELAAAAAQANPHTVAVTFSGRPLALRRLAQEVPAILHMWFPGTEGGNAVANLLFGKANPCGKLSMTFPQAVGQCPLYYNHTNTSRPKGEPDDRHVPYISNYVDCGNLPQYPFGYGLSYSRFVYEHMQLDKDVMSADDQIAVSVTVYNDNDVAGKETVQLYMQDVVASNARPVQQLIAFEKVAFAPHERKTITFTITEPMLRFWDNEQRHVSEPGEFLVFAGFADHRLLSDSFWLK